MGDDEVLGVTGRKFDSPNISKFPSKVLKIWSCQEAKNKLPLLWLGSYTTQLHHVVQAPCLVSPCSTRGALAGMIVGFTAGITRFVLSKFADGSCEPFELHSYRFSDHSQRWLEILGQVSKNSYKHVKSGNPALFWVTFCTSKPCQRNKLPASQIEHFGFTRLKTEDNESLCRRSESFKTWSDHADHPPFLSTFERIHFHAWHNQRA